MRKRYERPPSRIGKLRLEALAVLLFLPAACERPKPATAAAPPLRIIVPAAGKTVSETYPPFSLPTEPVKRGVFEQINRDRAENGAAPVAWDEAASQVADAFCTAQVAEKTRGHYLRDGVPPYARTGLAGVFGYQSENSASWLTTASSISETPLVLALSAERTMMEEKPPADGHRVSILDPEATHVGVGWAMGGGRFQLAEEFLARGLESLNVRAEEGAAILHFSGQARAPLKLEFVTIAHEALPGNLTRAEANDRTFYKYPVPHEAFVPEGRIDLTVVGTATRDRIRLAGDRRFSFAFAPGEPGLFTFVFWFGSDAGDRPRPGGSAVAKVES